MSDTYLPGDTRQRIQDLIKNRKITQAELAEKVGLSNSALSRYLQGGTKNLGDGYIIRIAKYFEVSTDFLLGETELATPYVDSEGRKANYPHYHRKAEDKLAREQRKLSRMGKGSSNYARQLLKVQKIAKKVRNQRKDFIFKEALKLSGEYDVVAVEDIDLRGLSMSLHLGKNLHDNGFGMFRRVLENKLVAKGSVLVKVDRYYPSTKRCSCCGSCNPEVTLGVKSWTCPECGTVHDRDENAAKNIRDEGRRILAESFISYMEKEAESRLRAKQRDEFRHRKRA